MNLQKKFHQSFLFFTIFLFLAYPLPNHPGFFRLMFLPCPFSSQLTLWSTGSDESTSLTAPLDSAGIFGELGLGYSEACKGLVPDFSDAFSLGLRRMQVELWEDVLLPGQLKLRRSTLVVNESISQGLKGVAKEKSGSTFLKQTHGVC